MSQSPFERAGNLRIGAVDFVSPDEIKVALDIEAPESVALFDDGVRPFPRVNGYLLIPVEETFLVGQVEWLTVEHSQFPKRRGMKDFGLVDLPYPLRKLRLNPLGTLRRDARGYAFTRGSDALPSVGATVVLPTEKQLRSIVESGEYRRVKIGTSALAGDANVFIDPNRLFGRHLAVLGNTGSGKSCSVAGLIRWSIEEAVKEFEGKQPNARFIILDPNGEYSRAFGGDDAINARIFKVPPVVNKNETALQVPLWFWNSAEWCSFTQASAKTQQPALMHALRFARSKHEQSQQGQKARYDMMRSVFGDIVADIHGGQDSGNLWVKFQDANSLFNNLNHWATFLEHDFKHLGKYPTSVQKFIEKAQGVCADVDKRADENQFNRRFTPQEVEDLLTLARDAHSALGDSGVGPILADVDAPRPFKGVSLIREVEVAGRKLGVSEHIGTLLVRIRTLLNDTRIMSIIDDSGIKLETWLEDYIGSAKSESGRISVIDLSLVPTEVVHVVTAVIARMVFEALQRHVKLKGAELPTVLVMEEAHTFIKRHKEDAENQSAADTCCQVFERIAREGRKFGLGLVVSSQRPSELSPTVLSQCNSFLLHRISNNHDQDLVRHLVPDNLRGLLRELPSLPSQNAILLGWASELPVLVKMNDLPESQQPRSDDPDFWEVWIGKDNKGKPVKRDADWKKIADDWQNMSTGKSGDGG